MTRVLVNSHVRDIFYRVADQYLDVYRGFSYDIQENDESSLLRSILTTPAIRRALEEVRRANGEISKRRGGGVILDVGANKGSWAAEVLKFAEDESVVLHLFDISSNLIEALREKFENEPRVGIHHIALSNSCDIVDYIRFPTAEEVNSLLTNSSFWEDLSSEKEIVQSLTGDVFCSQNGIQHIDFLKIDTEGWEWYVLGGFETMLRQNRISIVQFEYWYTTADTGVVMRDFYSLFDGLGYRVGPLRRNGVAFREFQYSDNDFKSGPNYVAVLNSLASALDPLDL